jgi:hypothetical protein
MTEAADLVTNEMEEVTGLDWVKGLGQNILPERWPSPCGSLVTSLVENR